MDRTYPSSLSLEREYHESVANRCQAETLLHGFVEQQACSDLDFPLSKLMVLVACPRVQAVRKMNSKGNIVGGTSMQNNKPKTSTDGYLLWIGP